MRARPPLVRCGMAIPPLQPLSKLADSNSSICGPTCSMRSDGRAHGAVEHGTHPGLASVWKSAVWPAGSPEREIVRTKRRRLDYLMIALSHASWWHKNADMAIRIEAARRSDRKRMSRLR